MIILACNVLPFHRSASPDRTPTTAALGHSFLLRVVIFVVIIVVAIVIAIATFVDTIVVRIASSGPLVVIVIFVVVIVIFLSVFTGLAARPWPRLPITVNCG